MRRKTAAIIAALYICGFLMFIGCATPQSSPSSPGEKMALDMIASLDAAIATAETTPQMEKRLQGASSYTTTYTWQKKWISKEEFERKISVLKTWKPKLNEQRKRLSAKLIEHQRDRSDKDTQKAFTEILMGSLQLYEAYQADLDGQ
ncbi:MAG: hypothetical protein P8X96_24640 [Desulfobacteraceae bacterium]